MAKLSDEEQEELMNEAWTQAYNVLMTGRLLLPNGESRKATNQEILSVMRHLMHLRAPKGRKVPLLDDLRLGRTDG